MVQELNVFYHFPLPPNPSVKRDAPTAALFPVSFSFMPALHRYGRLRRAPYLVRWAAQETTVLSR